MSYILKKIEFSKWSEQKIQKFNLIFLAQFTPRTPKISIINLLMKFFHEIDLMMKIVCHETVKTVQVAIKAAQAIKMVLSLLESLFY